MSKVLQSKKSSSTEESRANALHEVLSRKGMVPKGFIEEWRRIQDIDWDPANGARVVARAWMDPDYRRLLLDDGIAACSQFGYIGPQGEYPVAVENSSEVHNVIVCSLCSCTNWPIMGVPPEWYKSLAYRARVVREPRKVLAEMGTNLRDGKRIRVWDTTAETRYFVLPERPSGTDGWSEEQLMTLVTKDCLIGAAVPTVSELDEGGAPLDPLQLNASLTNLESGG